MPVCLQLLKNFLHGSWCGLVIQLKRLHKKGRTRTTACTHKMPSFLRPSVQLHTCSKETEHPSIHTAAKTRHKDLGGYEKKSKETDSTHHTLTGKLAKPLAFLEVQCSPQGSMPRGLAVRYEVRHRQGIPDAAVTVHKAGQRDLIIPDAWVVNNVF